MTEATQWPTDPTQCAILAIMAPYHHSTRWTLAQLVARARVAWKETDPEDYPKALEALCEAGLLACHIGMATAPCRAETVGAPGVKFTRTAKASRLGPQN